MHSSSQEETVVKRLILSLKIELKTLNESIKYITYAYNQFSNRFLHREHRFYHDKTSFVGYLLTCLHGRPVRRLPIALLRG